MYKEKVARLLSLCLCLGILFIVDLLVGSVYISFSDIWGAISGSKSNEIVNRILFDIRFPKAVTAGLAGAALSVSGLKMQTLFRNPLAGPSVLGITAGASLGVASVMLLMGGVLGNVSVAALGMSMSWVIVIAGVLGAMAVMSVILLVSTKVNDNIALLVIGIMMGNLTIAFVSIWQYFSAPEQIQDYLMWTFGSVGGVTSFQLWVLAFNVLVGLVFSFLLAKPLNMFLLGERYAQSMGLEIGKSRIGIILVSSLLAGTITGFCGPIGFVGVAVPHLARVWMKTSDHKLLIPSCVLIGVSIMLLCDVISQLPGTNATLPINAVTALIGSPIVIWVILKSKNLKRSI
ncbi:iron ABC transporter permease [Limibacter armeniacum]|uniref:iron ABC transporter permease n=1 Tax=Limibacter armeniacum TaxID=466084 RepID=UPI002FE53B1E